MRPVPSQFTDPFEQTKYRTVGILGEGSMGVVLAVEHRVMKKPFAAKVLKRELADAEAYVDRFVLEAEMLSSVEHPNIVRVFDVGQTPSRDWFYVMERLGGRTLTEYVEAHGPLTVGEAVAHARKLVSALRVVHDKGVVHRDLKPDNVFMVDSPRAEAGANLPQLKLLDFGVAKVVSNDGGVRAPLVPTTETLVGSPRFMAPELVLGRPADERSDIYSLGLLLHFMLRGALPFGDLTGVAALCRAQVEREPEALDPFVITPMLFQTVRVATVKEPDKRFKNMAELDQMLALIEKSTAQTGNAAARLPPIGASDVVAPDASPNRPQQRRHSFAWSAFVLGVVVSVAILLVVLLAFPKLASVQHEASPPTMGRLHRSLDDIRIKVS